jgi:hypothetical protein
MMISRRSTTRIGMTHGKSVNARPSALVKNEWVATDYEYITHGVHITPGILLSPSCWIRRSDPGPSRIEKSEHLNRRTNIVRSNDAGPAHDRSSRRSEASEESVVNRDWMVF